MTETLFNIGDKVTHDDLGPGEIVFGPLKMTYGATAYAVRLDNGEDRSLRADKLTARAGMYTVGDEAVYIGYRVKVIGGPVVGYISGDTRYLVEFVDGPDVGKGDGATEGRLSPAPASGSAKVGDRVRVVRAKYAEEYHGKTGTVISVTDTWVPTGDVLHPYDVRMDAGGEIAAAEVEKIADEPPTSYAVVNGARYNMGAQYRDKDDDVWVFQLVDGTARGESCDCCTPNSDSETLADVVSAYGPLTRV